jgi:hypothetical protein
MDNSIFFALLSSQGLGLSSMKDRPQHPDPRAQKAVATFGGTDQHELVSVTGLRAGP